MRGRDAAGTIGYPQPEYEAARDQGFMTKITVTIQHVDGGTKPPNIQSLFAGKRETISGFHYSYMAANG